MSSSRGLVLQPGRPFGEFPTDLKQRDRYVPDPELVGGSLVMIDGNSCDGDIGVGRQGCYRRFEHLTRATPVSIPDTRAIWGDATTD